MQDRNLTKLAIARKQNRVYSPLRQTVRAAMIPTESPAKLQITEAATHQNNDGFLYQCRVPRKISACVGGTRNGGPNSFHRRENSAVFPGQRVSSRWHNQRGVPVLITRTREGSKASINPIRRIPARARIFG